MGVGTGEVKGMSAPRLGSGGILVLAMSAENEENDIYIKSTLGRYTTLCFLGAMR